MKNIEHNTSQKNLTEKPTDSAEHNTSDTLLLKTLEQFTSQKNTLENNETSEASEANKKKLVEIVTGNTTTIRPSDVGATMTQEDVKNSQNNQTSIFKNLKEIGSGIVSAIKGAFAGLSFSKLKNWFQELYSQKNETETVTAEDNHVTMTPKEIKKQQEFKNTPTELSQKMLEMAKKMVEEKDKTNKINIYANNSEMLRKNGGKGMTCWDWGYEVAERCGIKLKKAYWNVGKSHKPLSEREHDKIVATISPGDKVVVHNGNTIDANGEHTVIAEKIVYENGKRYLYSYSFPGKGYPRRKKYDITKNNTIRGIEKAIA